MQMEDQWGKVEGGDVCGGTLMNIYPSRYGVKYIAIYRYTHSAGRRLNV